MQTLSELQFQTLAEKVFALLEGEWSIERVIEPGGHFIGMSSFRPMERDVLVYRESGQLVIGDGQIFSSERSYLYSLKDNYIEVVFHDGSSVGEHFVDLIFPENQNNQWPIETVSETHVCRLDNYDAIYRIESEDIFHITYIVCGPKKSYVSRTLFRRIGMPL
jgi:hypothetical protein